MKLSVTTLTLALIAAGVSLQASAVEPASQELRLTVRYTDLDLNKPEGAATLYSRIAHAARLVCPVNPPELLYPDAARHACMAEAIRRAVQKVDSPELSRYYVQKSGNSFESAKLLARGR